jgi:hypothetical protein
VTSAEFDPVLRYRPLSNARVQRDLALLLLVVGACAIPFLSQPFHMDDNFYLDMARNALSKPLFPNDTPYVFEGRFLPDMGSHSHPPLQTYFLALVLRFAGDARGTEWIFHLCALVYPLIAVWSLYFLSMRFVATPLWPALMLACTPLFMVMQHSLMTDVPTLAWWLAAVALFLRGTDEDRPGLLACSAVCQFAAMFTSYQSIALTPLLAWYQLRKGGKREGWVAVLFPLLAMVAWFGLNYAHYGRFLLNDTAGYIASRDPRSLGALWTKFLAILQYQGWLTVFPFFLIYIFGRGTRGRGLASAAIVSVYIMQAAVPHYRLIDRAIFAVGLLAGGAVLFQMARSFTRDVFWPQVSEFGGGLEGRFIGLWYFGVALYCLVLFTEGSARYILPLVPPLLICFFRRLETEETIEYRRIPRPMLSAAMVASGSVVLSLGWGLVLSHADQEFARVYPRAAAEFARIADGMESYYAGEWGFRYYFSQEGARQLPVDETRVGGASWLARPRLALPYDIPASLWTMSTPVQSLSYDVSTPVRILDWQVPAGFYSSGWGLIPFSFSRQSLDIIEIRQVNYLVDRLPWAKVDAPAGRDPWPGFEEIQGAAPLALIVRGNTRVTFPLETSRRSHLDLRIGIPADSWSEGNATSWRIRIQENNAAGETVSRFEKELVPGVRKEDRHWQPVRLTLHEIAGAALELEVRTGGDGRIAFAQAILGAAP